MNLSDFREDYRRGALDRAALEANPIAQFESWFQRRRAKNRKAAGAKSASRFTNFGAPSQPSSADINAMTLATVTKMANPHTYGIVEISGRARFYFFHQLRQPQGQGTGGESQRRADFFLAGSGAAGLRGGHGHQTAGRRNRRIISRAVPAAAALAHGRQTKVKCSRSRGVGNQVA